MWLWWALDSLVGAGVVLGWLLLLSPPTEAVRERLPDVWRALNGVLVLALVMGVVGSMFDPARTCLEMDWGMNPGDSKECVERPQSMLRAMTTLGLLAHGAMVGLLHARRLGEDNRPWLPALAGGFGLPLVLGPGLGHEDMFGVEHFVDPPWLWVFEALGFTTSAVLVAGLLVGIPVQLWRRRRTDA